MPYSQSSVFCRFSIWIEHVYFRRMKDSHLYISRSILFYRFSLHFNDLNTELHGFVKQMMLRLITKKSWNQI